MHTFPKARDTNVKNTTTIKMRWFLSFLLLGLFAAVNALSSSGNRLLVVLEESGEKDKYSKFLGDLEGECSRAKHSIIAHLDTLADIILTINPYRSRIQNHC